MVEYSARSQDGTRQRPLGEELREFTAALFARKGVIIASTTLALAVALVFVMFVTPLYRATTQVLVDPRPKRVVQSEVVPSGLGSSAIGADALLVDSQVEVIASDSVLRRVLRDQNLSTDDEFLRGGGLGFRRALVELFEPMVGLKPKTGLPPDEVALERLRERLDIRRAGNTYVINIRMLSRDPVRAAAIANAVSAAYLADTLAAAQRTTRETATSLTARLDDMRERVRVAEAAVETYRSEAGLVGARGVRVDEQQLQELNNRLVIARAATAAARARFEQLRAPSRAGDGSAGASAEALQSNVVQNLRSQLADIARREAEALAQTGPRNPIVRGLQAEREGVNRMLEGELRRITESARNDLAVAQANETSLDRSLEGLRREASASNQKIVRLRELEREAEANRAVYESFLRRAKEANEQDDLSPINARIITQAVPPLRPAWPPRLLIVAAALIGGLGLGVVLAWLMWVIAPPREDGAYERA